MNLLAKAISNGWIKIKPVEKTQSRNVMHMRRLRAEMRGEDISAFPIRVRSKKTTGARYKKYGHRNDCKKHHSQKHTATNPSNQLSYIDPANNHPTPRR